VNFSPPRRLLDEIDRIDEDRDGLISSVEVCKFVGKYGEEVARAAHDRAVARHRLWALGFGAFFIIVALLCTTLITTIVTYAIVDDNNDEIEKLNDRYKSVSEELPGVLTSYETGAPLVRSTSRPASRILLSSFLSENTSSSAVRRAPLIIASRPTGDERERSHAHASDAHGDAVESPVWTPPTPGSGRGQAVSSLR